MEIMKLHVTKVHFFRTMFFFLHLSGPIEQIYTHYEIS